MGSTVIRLTGIVVALVVGACGDDAGNRKIMDAPAIGRDEGMIDGAENSPVTVTVKGSTGPVANIEVYFQNADSTLVATSHTDANGVASQVMDPGGFVTLVNPFGLQPPPGFGGVTTNLDTWAGVKPGDHLVFDTGTGNMSSSVTMQLPLDTAHGTVSGYTISTTCNGEASVSAPSGTGVSTVSTAVFFNGCTGTADVMVVANDVDGQAISYFYVPAQPITDGDTIDYTAKTYSAATQRAFEFDNNPSSDNTIEVLDRFVTSRGQVYAASATAVGGTTSTTTVGDPALPTGAMDIVQTRQVVASTDRRTIAWGPAIADYTVDYGASLTADFNVDPTFDTGTQTLAWTLGTGKAPVFSSSSIAAQRSGVFWSWEIVGPSGTQVTLPTLPTDVGNFTIMATDAIFIDGVGIGYMPGGYDAFRAIAFQGVNPTGASGIAGYNFWQQLQTAQPSLFKKMHVRAATPKRIVAPRRVWSKH